MPSTPQQGALKALRRKHRLAAGLTSAQYSRLPAEIRERALFSACVEEGRLLEQIRKVCVGVTSGELTEGQAKAKLKQWLERTDYKPEPGERGTIKDLSSNQRLQVIVNTNVMLADGWGREAWQSERQKLFPANELFRAEPRNQPRNWAQRWTSAGGRIRRGRFLAPFGDRIWTRISRFGHPYHIFDYNSGMHKRMISRQEAKRLGIATPTKPAPRVGLNKGLASKATARWHRSTAKALQSILPGFTLGTDGVLRRV